jgi:predicted transcriptional regulator
MIIVGVREMHRTATEFDPGLQHRAMHAVSVEALASKRRQERRMDIHDAVSQCWWWCVERQKASQDHQINGVAGEHGMDRRVERLGFRVVFPGHRHRLQVVLLRPYETVGLTLAADDDGYTRA